ncbi:MAG: tetratricopeptide repeat protein, partial [Candidatus Acidiferrum sp.]
MNRFAVRCSLLALPLLLAANTWAQQPPATQVTEASSKESVPPAPVAPIATLGQRQLFGTLQVATKSDDARKLLEKSIDQYENYLLEMSASTAHEAAAKDPHFALAFAVWSYETYRSQPAPEALKHAKALAPKATPDEQLLINWMVDVQEGNNLAAIGAMNDLVARFPNDKHVLYLTSEWLYSQQDYERARKMMEKILQIDSTFPPVYNMLGYSYIETGDPDAAKAVSYLERYAVLEPHHPNPQDSLGEVLRHAGDDQGSLEHYAAALKIITNFYSSQIGIADTRTLMGDYAGARTAYDKVSASATNSRDRFHVQFQKALVSFWEGQPEQGRKSLDSLLEQSRRQKDPYAQFEIGFGRAQLSTDPARELEQLSTLEGSLQKPITGMSEPDRNVSLASVLREEARIAAANGNSDRAQEAIAKLERAAAITRDLIVENNYESARGYALFAQGDLANAADELATDPHSPLALQQLALAQEKLGNSAAAESIRTRLKYQRGPTVEWYLTTHA